jgi:hypothetical protein
MVSRVLLQIGEIDANIFVDMVCSANSNLDNWTYKAMGIYDRISASFNHRKKNIPVANSNTGMDTKEMYNHHRYSGQR